MAPCGLTEDSSIDGQQRLEEGVQYTPGGEVPGTGQFDI